MSIVPLNPHPSIPIIILSVPRSSAHKIRHDIYVLRDFLWGEGRDRLYIDDERTMRHAIKRGGCSAVGAAQAKFELS